MDKQVDGPNRQTERTDRPNEIGADENSDDWASAQTNRLRINALFIHTGEPTEINTLVRKPVCRKLH